MPTLIIVPNTLMEHWAFVYYKYFEFPLCETVLINKDTVSNEKKTNKAKPTIYITSYQMVEKKTEYFSSK